MELTLVFLVLLELTSNVLVDTFAFHIDSRVNLVVGLLLFVVYLFNFRIASTEGSEFLDLRSKSILLILDFRFDLDDQLVELLERLTLSVIKLLFKFRNTLDLIFNVRESLDSMFLFKFAHNLVDILATRLKNLLSSLKDDDFTLDFIKNLFHHLKVSVFDT